MRFDFVHGATLAIMLDLEGTLQRKLTRPEMRKIVGLETGHKCKVGPYWVRKV